MTDNGTKRPRGEVALQALENRNRAYRIIYETVMEVEGADEQKAFFIICRNLLRLTGGRVAGVAGYDSESRSLTLESLCRREKSGRVSRLDFPREKAAVSRAVVRSFQGKRIQPCVAHRGCLVEIFSRTALKGLHLRQGKNCYQLSCCRDGELLAAGFLQAPAGQKLYLKDMLDTYLSLAGIVIQRIYAFRSLEESEKEKSLILGSVDELITYQDREFRIIWANRAAGESVGKKPSDLVGRFCYEVWQGRDRACDPCPVEEAIRSGKARRREVTTPDGRIWAIGAYPVRDRNGRISGAVEITRNTTADKLREEELARHDLVYRSMREAVLIFDRKGRITDANPAAEKVFGWSREELRGKKAETLNPPRQGRQITAEIMRGMKEKGKWEGILPIITRSGRKRHMSTIISSLRDRSGNWLGNIGINRDITEKVQAEEALIRQERHYRALFNASPSPISLLDQDGKIVNVNSAFCEVMGYSREEVIGMNPRDFSVSDSAKQVKKNIRRVLAGESLRHIVTNRRKDGTKCCLDLHEASITLPNGKPGILCVAADVTEQRHAEEALRESEIKFKHLFNGMSSGVAVYQAVDGGRNFIIRDFNRAGEELEKVKREAILGRRVTEVFPGVETMGLLDAFRRVWTKGKPERLPASLYQDGRIAAWRDNYIYKLPSGEVVAVYDDVTERKRLEEELAKIQKLESLGLLAGGIAHDFNNLLTAIMGNISIAKLKAGGEGDAGKFLAEAESSCLRAKNLTQQLLTFSRGGKPITKTVSLAGILREAARFSLSGSKARPEFSIAKDLRPVEADDGQIYQVINNLIINAEQAMPGGGVIEIGARNIALDKRSGLPLPPGEYILLTVRDSGTGIPEKYLSRVFDPYFTTKKQGSGLGLSTSFSIIKNHSGLITADSEEGKGTTFSVYLPAADKAAPARNGGRKEIVRGRGRVLLMDDDPSVLRVASRMVEYLGYEVVAVSDGEEAIREYKEARQAGRPFDAVILDLTVPGGRGGQETIRELKELDPGVKALVSSGYSTDAVMADFRRFGFRGVIAKPYELAELSKILHQVLGKKK